MADNTFTDEITDSTCAVPDAPPAQTPEPEDSAPQTDPDDMLADEEEFFEWLDSEVAEARVFRPYTPPPANTYVPLVVTACKPVDISDKSFFKEGDYRFQLDVEAEHLSGEWGDKTYPYRVFLSKVNDRNPKRRKTPMATAFLATGVIVKDNAAGAKKRPLQEMAEEMIGGEFISRVYYQDRQAKESVPVDAYWGEFGTMTNGDGEILKETDKKSDAFGKVRYYNPLLGTENYTGDTFVDADENPITSNLVYDEDTKQWSEGSEEIPVTFGVNHPLLTEDMGFGKPGTRIADLDGDNVTVYQRTTKTYECIDAEFHPMPDREITVDGETWYVTYETVVNLMPPIKPSSTVVTAIHGTTYEEAEFKYCFDGTWARQATSDAYADKGAAPEDAGFVG